MFLNELLHPAAIPTQLQSASFAETRKKINFNICTVLFVCLFLTHQAPSSCYIYLYIKP